VTLTPMSPENADEVEALDLRRELLPAMGGAFERVILAAYAPPVVIVDNTDGVPIGTLEHDSIVGHPGVVNLTIYADPQLARPGHALEAFGLYMDELFKRGVAVVHLEVLESNRQVIRLLERRGFKAHARYREHAYVAARRWDVLVYAVNKDEWEAIVGRFRRSFPGARAPAALGGSKFSREAPPPAPSERASGRRRRARPRARS